MGTGTLALALAMAGLFFLAQVALGADIQVDQDCALADAITAANTDESVGGCAAGDGADIITLGMNALLTDELPLIKSAVTINGIGKRFISGDNRYRIFVVGAEGSLTLRNLTLARGYAREESAVCGTEVGSTRFGGAVCNLGELVVLDSRFTRNEAERGGAVYSAGDARVKGGNFSDNTSAGDGGAIYLQGGSISLTASSLHDNESGGGGGALFNAGGSLTISDSLVFDNEAQDDGGAIRAEGGGVEIQASTFNRNVSADDGGALRMKNASLRVNASTFGENAAGDLGGAIHSVLGMTRVVNSAFHGNRASGGGAISSADEDALLKHVTIALNSAGSVGGGLLAHGESEDELGRMFLQHSILADNDGGDCHVGAHGQIVDNSYTLVGDGACEAARAGDAGLGELAHPVDGGPAYFPLLADSAAIDAGDPFLCLAVDQIGTARPQGDGCDLGAIEYAGSGP